MSVRLPEGERLRAALDHQSAVIRGHQEWTMEVRGELVAQNFAVSEDGRLYRGDTLVGVQIDGEILSVDRALMKVLRAGFGREEAEEFLKTLPEFAI